MRSSDLFETISVDMTEVEQMSGMTGKALKTKILKGIKSVLPVGIEPTTNG